MKMYCIFARESIEKMGGNRGKLAAQAGHAFLNAFLRGYKANEALAMEYLESGSPKICVVTPTADDLEILKNKYQYITSVELVTDAARTVFAAPTITCLGIGPIDDELVQDDIRELKVLL